MNEVTHECPKCKKQMTSIVGRLCWCIECEIDMEPLIEKTEPVAEIPCSDRVMLETFNQGSEVYVRASITLTGKSYQEGAKAFLIHKATGIALKRLSEKILEETEEEEAYDNMPEGLQGSEKGEAMENAIGSLEQAESGIEEATESISEAVEG